MASFTLPHTHPNASPHKETEVQGRDGSSQHPFRCCLQAAEVHARHHLQGKGVRGGHGRGSMRQGVLCAAKATLTGDITRG